MLLITRFQFVCNASAHLCAHTPCYQSGSRSCACFEHFITLWDFVTRWGLILCKSCYFCKNGFYGTFVKRRVLRALLLLKLHPWHEVVVVDICTHKIAGIAISIFPVPQAGGEIQIVPHVTARRCL